MFNHGDYPHTGDIVKIDIIDMTGFKNDVFGANKLLQLTEKQRSNNQLYGCMLTMDMWDYFGTDDNENHAEIYLLDENNLIIHDTAFLSDEDLKYVQVELIDRPECINDFAKNMDISCVKLNHLIRHNDGRVFKVSRRTECDIYVHNIDNESDSLTFDPEECADVNFFCEYFPGFINNINEDLITFTRGRRTRRKFTTESSPEEMAKWFDAIKILAAAGNERLRQMSRETEAEKRRSQFKIIEGGNDK